jgi:hypothetical protein
MTTETHPEPTRCTECRRPLTSAASIARGMGRTCARTARRRAAAFVLTRQFKGAEAARTKALQLIADGALVRTRHEGQYLAVASDGLGTYLVDAVERSCTCKGHARQGRCYHLVAADVVEITTTRRSAYALAA